MKIDFSHLDHSRHPTPSIREAWECGIKVLQPTPAQLQRGLELHADAFVCDNFGFFPSIWNEEVSKNWNELRDDHVGARELQWRISMIRETNATRDPEVAKAFSEAYRITGMKCTVKTVAEGKQREEDIKRMSNIIHTMRVLRKTVSQAGSKAQIEELNQSNKTAVIWSVNGPPIVGALVDYDEEMSWIQTWYNLGVRMMHLSYNRRNFIADGCAEPANGGLSELGKDLIACLNRVGIIVDTPHTGKQSTLDAARLTQKPMMASHTGAEQVFMAMRCKSDEEIKAIAHTDGLIGVYALSSMLGPDASIQTILDHIDHIVKITGPNHAAIGTDFCYNVQAPADVKGYPKTRFNGTWWGAWYRREFPKQTDPIKAKSLAWINWPLFTVGLVTRGYSDQDIRQILGLNFLRVLEANRPTHELQLS